MHEEIQIYVHKFHGGISQCGFFVHTARTFWEYLVALVNRIRVGLVGKVVLIGASLRSFGEAIVSSNPLSFPGSDDIC